METKPGAKETLTMTVADVAAILNTKPDKVRDAILNGTMPVGMVGQGDHSSKTRVIIVRRRFEKWMAGELRL